MLLGLYKMFRFFVSRFAVFLGGGGGVIKIFLY